MEIIMSGIFLIETQKIEQFQEVCISNFDLAKTVEKKNVSYFQEFLTKTSSEIS
jgi:hypothetical protein